MLFLRRIVSGKASRLKALSPSCSASLRVVFQPILNGRSVLSQMRHSHSVGLLPHSVMINLNIVKRCWRDKKWPSQVKKSDGCIDTHYTAAKWLRPHAAPEPFMLLQRVPHLNDFLDLAKKMGQFPFHDVPRLFGLVPPIPAPADALTVPAVRQPDLTHGRGCH